MTENRPVTNYRELLQTSAEWGAVVYGEELIGNYAGDPAGTVLLVSHELSLSGAPVVLLNLALSLKKAGWQTLIISPADGALGSYAADHGIPAVYFPDLYGSGFAFEIRNMFAAVIACTIVTAPVVRELDGTDTPVMWWIHEAAAVYSEYMIAAMPDHLSDNVFVYCGGDYAKQMLEERFPRYKTETFLYYVKDTARDAADTGPHFRTLEDGQKVFACIGLIEQRKGQDILLEAIDDLPDEVRRNCRFILVGKAADQEIKEQIEEMRERYPQQIVFHEGLGLDELHGIYREMDFLICSSRDDPMPVVAADAMSLGRPCICSVNTGTADIIKRYEAGLIYGNNDPRGLAELIGHACCMPEEEYLQLSANARKAFEKEFSEELFEKKLDEIMNKLISAGNGRSWINVTVVIPTLNAERYMPELLSRIHSQTLQPCEIIVVDSSSDDRTADICRDDDVTFICIKREDFDHGRTRDMAVRCSRGDFVVFFSQDALPADSECLERLTAKLGQDGIAVCTGRQIAREDAGIAEKLIRAFNYPKKGNIRSKSDRVRLGIKTYFASNSCSAYDRKVYLELGGFDHPVMSNEDMFFAAKVINSGYKIAYCADAKVYHSHDHSVKELFVRNFREGYEIERHMDRLGDVSLESEGLRMVREVGGSLLRQGHILSLIRFGVECTSRLAGNRLGRYRARTGGPEGRIK